MRTMLAALLLAGTALAQGADFSGEWLTDLGMLEITQSGTSVEGSYGTSTLVGNVVGNKCKFTWTQNGRSGPGEFELQKGHRHFTGKWSWPNGNFGGVWRGWKPDPNATKGKPAKVAGMWFSSWGTMVLTQNGDTVKGTYGSQGYGKVVGTVEGRKVRLTWTFGRNSGPAWIELTKDGKSFFGRSQTQRFSKWLGIRVPKEFKKDVKPKAGKLVKGITKNGVPYLVRAPAGWKPGQPTDAIVLLHGSNWTTLGMVAVTAKMKDLGRRFMIIGIQGDQWADWSTEKDLRHNYHYVNFMGRSTYKGYPFTDRDSPLVVADIVADLRKRLHLKRVFCGGHSQGGYLAHILHMHFPERFDGVFPMSCALVIQAEPDVFDDEELRKAQRATPLAIVHGKNDTVVKFPAGEYSFQRFVASGFPYMTFITPPNNHAYDFLPIPDVIAYLDAMSTKDGAVLSAYAQKRAEQDAWRDVAAACLRARALGAPLEQIEAQLDRAAKDGLDKYTPLVKANKDGTWIDGFLAWRDQFEYAPSAGELMAAFRALAAQHGPEAKRLENEARQAFRARDPDTGWAKYGEIVKTCYCAPKYRIIKQRLANRN